MTEESSMSTNTPAPVAGTAAGPKPTPPKLDSCNLAVVVGTVPGPPRRRTLPSGDELVEFDVTTRGPAGTCGVPIAWFAPGKFADAIGPGTMVAVAGSVRRRFFRSGGPTQSRTEVVAVKVVDASKRTAFDRLLAEVAKGLAGEPPR
jgi:single-strand DNA-binding protein